LLVRNYTPGLAVRDTANDRLHRWPGTDDVAVAPSTDPATVEMAVNDQH
jgi:hypothetical protein